MVFCHSDHWKGTMSISPWSLTSFGQRQTFWGSSGSSLGCGQRTIFPSGVSFRRDATLSPNSMRASLFHGLSTRGTGKRKENRRTRDQGLVGRHVVHDTWPSQSARNFRAFPRCHSFRRVLSLSFLATSIEGRRFSLTWDGQLYVEFR